MFKCFLINSTLKQPIELYKKQSMDDEEISLHIDVRRKCILQDALKEGRKKKFDTRKRLEVETLMQETLLLQI